MIARRKKSRSASAKRKAKKAIAGKARVARRNRQQRIVPSLADVVQFLTRHVREKPNKKMPTKVQVLEEKRLPKERVSVRYARAPERAEYAGQYARAERTMQYVRKDAEAVGVIAEQYVSSVPRRQEYARASAEKSAYVESAPASRTEYAAKKEVPRAQEAFAIMGVAELVQDVAQKSPEPSIDDQMSRLQVYEERAVQSVQNYQSGRIDAQSAEIIGAVKERIGYKGRCCDDRLVNALVEYQEKHNRELGGLHELTKHCA